MIKKEGVKMFKQAVEEYGKYTDNQSKVLCALVENAVDNLVYTPVVKLNKQTGVLRPSIYAALKALQLDGVISKDITIKGAFQIQQEKINFILNSYKKTH